MVLRFSSLLFVILFAFALVSCTTGTVESDCPVASCNGQCVNTQIDPMNCGVCGNMCLTAERCEGGMCVSMCSPGMEYCNGVCASTRDNPQHCGGCGIACTPAEDCQNGVCTGGSCPPGQTDCFGSCVDTRNDAANCGSCGNRCDGACDNGTCATSCPEGQDLCSGVCVDLQKDEANCGGCGNPCNPGEECEAGLCESSCAADLTFCDPDCVNVTTDPDNCGRCGNFCSDGQVCTGGSCSDTGCPGTQTDCGGTCVETDTDRDNCGRCGNVCSEGRSCVRGSCDLVCPDRLERCGEDCVDLTSDRANCGACGTACRGDQLCTGRCECRSGWTDCSGACVNTDTDRAHCGACGNGCTGSSACVDGACSTTCPPGTEPCGGECVDVSSDRNHCGACGTVCPADQTCSSGSCTTSVVVPGDSCSSPINVSGGGRFEGNAASASADYTGSCGGARGRDIVFQYTLTETTDVYMNTFGSDYDTVLYVTNDCGGGTERGCSDDERGTLRSELLLLDQPAGTYYVIVDSFFTSAGNYDFDIYFSAPSFYGGDACGEPEYVDVSTISEITGNTCSWVWFNARDDTRACRRGTDGNDEVFYFVVRTTTTVTFATCDETDFDTILDLRRVCDDDSDDARVQCNDDSCGIQSSITATLAPGVYYLWIDGYGEEDCGSFEIQVTRG